MTDEPEEQSSEPFDPKRYLNIVRRRHIHFLIPLLVGWLAVWGASWFLPTLYKSSTLDVYKRQLLWRYMLRPKAVRI